MGASKSKLKRGNFVFKKYKTDHGFHVHVYGKDRSIVKWDLENETEIKGKITGKIKMIIENLRKEGWFKK